MTDEPILPPPHDIAAEEAVLAAGLWGDPLAYELGLSPWEFWAVEHRQIWAVLLAAEELLGDDIDAARCIRRRICGPTRLLTPARSSPLGPRDGAQIPDLCRDPSRKLLSR